MVNNETERFLAAILASSRDAIVGKTLDGIIRSWNRGAEELFGYRAEEVIGKSIEILWPSPLRHEMERMLDEARAGRSRGVETIGIAKDGREIDVALTGFPILNDHGEVVGSAAIARDIRE